MKSVPYITLPESAPGMQQPTEFTHHSIEHDESHSWWDQSISNCELGLYPDFWIPDACGVDSPPCMDPTCEDYLPCEAFPHPCKPEECFGLVCTSEKCESEKSCFNADCLQSHCITPGCDQECLNIPCGPSCPDTVCLKDVCCEADGNHHSSTCYTGFPLHPKISAPGGRPTSNSSHPFEILRLACANVIDSQPATRDVPSARGANELSVRMNYENKRPEYSFENQRGVKRGVLNTDLGGTKLESCQWRAKSVSTGSFSLKQEDHARELSSIAIAKVENEEAQSRFFTCLWAEPTIQNGIKVRVACGKRFISEEQLQNHLEACHVEKLLQKRNIHKRASLSSSSKSSITQNSKLFDDDLHCHWLDCPRDHAHGFAVKGKLQIHLRTHTGYKPFPCPLCPSRFKTPDALAKHTRTHTGERPYECLEPGCGRKFATPTELKTHATVHSGERPHACPICGQQFADSSNLSKHKKTHREKSHVCMQCGAKFTRSDHLERHCVKLGHCLDATGRTVRRRSRASSISTVSELTTDGGGYVY